MEATVAATTTPTALRLVEGELVGRIWSLMQTITCRLGSLAFLSSLRNSNNGGYRHDDLSPYFSADKVNEVFARYHEEVFAEWMSLSRKQQLLDVDCHLSSLGSDRSQVTNTWIILQPFCTFVPMKTTSAERAVFRSDVLFALSLLARESQQHGTGPLTAQANSPEMTLLTPTERKIMRQVGEGKTSKEIAVLLGLSYHTIANHRKAICQKLHFQSGAELIAFAGRLIAVRGS
jgi:DNA-binding CsgD family transcriptional regulator